MDCKSTRAIAEELSQQHHTVSHMKVAQILHDLDYRLQSNRKTEEGADHPDRDAQFRHSNVTVNRCLRQGIPVISVDTKKKELVGNYHNTGQQGRAAKQSTPVQGHDFPSPQVPRAYPYGIYDIGRTHWQNSMPTNWLQLDSPLLQDSVPVSLTMRSKSVRGMSLSMRLNMLHEAFTLGLLRSGSDEFGDSPTPSTVGRSNVICWGGFKFHVQRVNDGAVAHRLPGAWRS